jgi:hypothetical protein
MGGSYSVDEEVIRPRCGANANVWAVWIRATIMQVLVESDERFGVFVQDGVLEDKLIDVIATVPIHAMSVDPNEVLRRITGT